MAILADKTKELIELLSDKTNDNTIQWTKTSADNGFQYIFKKGSIIINNSYDFNLDRAYMNLILFNDIGEVIEDTYVNSDEEKNYFNYLKDFHDLIKRKYLKVDETIESFFKELGKDDDLPPI